MGRIGLCFVSLLKNAYRPEHPANVGSHDQANASTGVPSILPSIAKATCNKIELRHNDITIPQLLNARIHQPSARRNNPSEGVTQAGRLQGLAETTHLRVATTTFQGLR